jgi:hypothetical protein
VLSAQEAERVDVTAISAAMLAVVAARAVAAGRELTGAEPLYLRAPDVTLPKSVARRVPRAAHDAAHATVDDLADIMDLERVVSDRRVERADDAREPSPHAHYLVDVEAGRLLAYGGVRAVARAADADIQTITVAASARGRGGADCCGRSEAARQRGARECSSRCVPTTRPPPRCTSRRVPRDRASPRYYQPDDVDAVVMKLDLVAWAAERRADADRGVCS